jgi:general secretion pathway protein C
MALPLRIVWLSRLTTFGLAAVAAASAAFWALQWSGAVAVTPMVAVEGLTPLTPDTAAVARALGGAGSASMSSSGASSTALASSRFALTGVVASSSQQGAALIALDGKPAKPYAVGARVGDEWVLQSVQARRAVLVPVGAADASSAASNAELVLQLPLPAIDKNKR